VAIAQYRLKAAPVWAEKIEGDLQAIADLVTRWGLDVYINQGNVKLTIPPHKLAKGAERTGTIGDWLVDYASGCGVVADEVFTASFEAAP